MKQTPMGGVNRIPLYDNLKAIGIILVLLGHVTKNHSLSGFIYSFHMPLFFFVSGMLYKQKKHYAVKLARVLLWPYLTFALLSFLYWAVIEIKWRPIPESTSILEQFINIIYPMNMDKYPFIMNVVLWFLPALYICSICHHYILSKIHNLNMQLMVIAIIALALQCFKFWLPLYIPQALCALPFFTLGNMLNDRIILTGNVTRHTQITIHTTSIIFFILLYQYSLRADMSSMGYPLGYIPYFLVACCSVLLLCIISPRKNNRVLCFLGSNSLAIMLIHEPIKRIIIKGYSVTTTIDTSIIRESVPHSIVITIILLAVLYPIILFTRKYCGVLFKL